MSHEAPISESKAPGRLPLSDVLLYGAGNVGLQVYGLIALAWVLMLYRGNADLHLPPLTPAIWFAAVFFIGRLFDGVIDPVIGFLSDRTRSRWGRRKPFILVGILPQSLFFLLLWTPPRATESAVNAVYLLAMLCGFFLFYVLVFGPYLAMMPELTDNDTDRNRVATVQAAFGIAGTVFGSCYGLLFRHFAGPGAAQPMRGFLGAAVVTVLASTVTTLLPLFVRHRPAETPVETFSLREGLAATLACRPFRIYIGAYLTVWIALQLVLAALPQMPIARLGATPEQNGAWASVLQVIPLLAGFAAFPLLQWLMNRYGRAWTWAAAMSLFAVTVPWTVVPRSLGAMAFLLALAGPAIGGLMILPHAILSDICDHDAQRTGMRREALFFGMQGMFTKASIALSMVLASTLLDHLGNTSARPYGLLACPLVATVAIVISLVLFRGYQASLDA